MDRLEADTERGVATEGRADRGAAAAAAAADVAVPTELRSICDAGTAAWISRGELEPKPKPKRRSRSVPADEDRRTPFTGAFLGVELLEDVAALHRGASKDLIIGVTREGVEDNTVWIITWTAESSFVSSDEVPLLLLPSPRTPAASSSRCFCCASCSS
mmetsp:Transcript_23195/g.50920  ORF Transcript_23195/g.50920 Transcript_23195/m.50920 type:complete len:159 (+) Transcript_23195:841-1317(+)